MQHGVADPAVLGHALTGNGDDAADSLRAFLLLECAFPVEWPEPLCVGLGGGDASVVVQRAACANVSEIMRTAHSGDDSLWVLSHLRVHGVRVRSACIARAVPPLLVAVRAVGGHPAGTGAAPLPARS